MFIEEENPLDKIIGESKEDRRTPAEQHEQARLVMADLEDIMYSAVVKAVGDLFGE